MHWTYTDIANDSMDTVIHELGREYNFHPDEASSAKIAYCNMKGGVAMGVIFHNPAIQWPAKPFRGKYAVKSWNTNGGYNSLYEDAVRFLNSLDNDTAFFARAAYSNLEHGDSWLSIYYPST